MLSVEKTRTYTISFEKIDATLENRSFLEERFRTCEKEIINTLYQILNHLHIKYKTDAFTIHNKYLFFEKNNGLCSEKLEKRPQISELFNDAEDITSIKKENQIELILTYTNPLKY